MNHATEGVMGMGLKERVFECIPAGQYALSGLLRLLDVVETDSVATAAVECHAQPRLLINPAWVARHANTPEKLMMLVMHEVHHVLLGHTRRFERLTPADNFIFDAIINALLCRMFPQGAYTALFRDFYREDRFPDCLLRPATGWDPRQATAATPTALQAPKLKRAARVHQALYSRVGVSYEDLRDLIRFELVRQPGLLVKVPLMGDHRSDAQGRVPYGGIGSSAEGRDNAEVAAAQEADGESSRIFAAAVGEIVSRWPTPPQPVRGFSIGQALREMRTHAARSPSRRALLRQLIRRIAPAQAVAQGALSPVQGGRVVESPIPVNDRRSLVMQRLGLQPLLYRTELEQPQPLPAHERVHLYLDVSGSLGDLKSILYGAALDCFDLLHPKVHLFSDQVKDISIAELRAGVVHTTGGTDIHCITRHLKQHRIRRAVIVTDGFVGAPDLDAHDTLNKTRLGVAYVGGWIRRSDLAPYTDASVDLMSAPREEEGEEP